MTASDILRTAADLVYGDRHDQHGDAKVCHQNISLLWTAYLGQKITPKDVALLLALLKIARTKTGAQNGDNFVDLCGYGALAGELAEPPA